MSKVKAASPVKVLFVCLGNICRSPTAQGVFQKLVDDAGLSDKIIVDSAGTGDWHIGKGPDARAIAAAGTRGFLLDSLIARQVTTKDFEQFNYVLAMDSSNLGNLKRMRPSDYAGRLSLFLDYSTGNVSNGSPGIDVPDPYYGGDDGFETVLDLIEDASKNLLVDVKQRYQL